MTTEGKSILIKFEDINVFPFDTVLTSKFQVAETENSGTV